MRWLGNISSCLGTQFLVKGKAAAWLASMPTQAWQYLEPVELAVGLFHKLPTMNRVARHHAFGRACWQYRPAVFLALRHMVTSKKFQLLVSQQMQPAGGA
eukprot:364840-Chlamydomonas_euryale.AAC.4